MKRVNLKAVYSKLASCANGISNIKDRPLSLHQAQTYQLLDDPNLDVVFNTALTGDGKSLAAYLPALSKNRRTMGLYPTNELSRDQENQVKSYTEQLSLTKHKQRVCRLDSESLTELAEGHNTSRQNELLTQFQEREILLANPDIYHLLMNGYYLRRNDLRDKMFSPLIKYFALTVFDEFHIFSAPQIVSVVNALLLVRATHGLGQRKFLFLSATPSKQLRDNLERAGLRYAIVEGVYHHALASETGTIDLSEYRRITHQVALSFDITSRHDSTAEQWLCEKAEATIIEFFNKHPGSRCAVILNSVGAVKRCVRRLRPLLARHGLSVGENTGFSTKDERRESMSQDVLIGTSTIDIGVDFKINLLIFEATDSGNFIQRLGRLGRHDGYQNERGETINFTAFQAYALVPPFIHERLFAKPDEDGIAPLQDGACYDRQTFFARLREVYPRVNDFELYAQRWGGLQSACVYLALGQKEIKPVYDVIREKLRADYEAALSLNWKWQLGRVRDFLKGKQRDEQEILNAARSFRGGGELECGVIDRTVADARQQFKTYGLPGVLTNCVITEVLSQEEFKARAETAGVKMDKFRYCRLFLVIGDYRDAPMRWRFHLQENLDDQAVARVRAATGVSVVLDEPEFQNPINRHLKRLKLVYYIVKLDNFSAKRRGSLPQLFPLYSLTDLRTMGDSQPSYSIAFGQEALLAETVFFYLQKPPSLLIV